MNPETWEKIKELYTAAMELPPAKRPDFIHDACKDDETAAREALGNGRLDRAARPEHCALKSAG